MSLKPKTLVDFSFQALKANKLRSFLTMLGIIIGVASVILMIAIGQGAQAQVMSRVKALGSNVMMVLPGALGRFGAGSEGTAQSLTLEEAGAVARLPYVANVAPVVRRAALVTHGANSWTTTITGTTPSITAISSTMSTVEGRFFSPADEKSAAPVAVLGQTVWQNLYPNGSDPVGTTITIKGVPFTVIGLLQSAGASMGGNNQDDFVYVPLKTAQIRLFGITFIGLMEVQAAGQKEVTPVINEVTALLHRLHGLPPGAPNDFTVRNLSQILSTAQDISGMLTLFLAGVAAISLIVGGIGIMNIMLVSVSERTREIGIRMAIGATQRDILNQFLTESIVLSLTGSFIGIVLGVGAAVAVSAFAHFPTPVSSLSIVAAVAFAIFVGVFFGYYPARRAANLNPADALSYE